MKKKIIKPGGHDCFSGIKDELSDSDKGSENGEQNISLIRNTILGNQEAEILLRKKVSAVLEKVSNKEIEDPELKLAMLALASFPKQGSTKPEAAIIAVDNGQILLQVWSEPDASDVYTRPITGLEKALLIKNFKK